MHFVALLAPAHCSWHL